MVKNELIVKDELLEMFIEARNDRLFYNNYDFPPTTTDLEHDRIIWNLINKL